MTRKILSVVSIKAVVIAALFAGTATTSTDAHAGRYHHSYYGGGYHHAYHGRGHYYGHRHRYHRHRYRRHHRDRDIAYLAGGLILGGIIVDSIHRNRDHHRDHHVVRERRIVEPSYGRANVGRHLHRDRYGNCFERTGNGDLIELPPSSCAW